MWGIFLTHSFHQPKGFIYFAKCNYTNSHRSQTKDHYAKFSDIFQDSIKQKIKSLQQICFQRQKKVVYENLSCQKARLPIATRVQTSRKTNWLTCQPIKLEFHTFTKTLPYEILRKKTNHKSSDTFMFFLYFFSRRNILSSSEKSWTRDDIL